MDLDAGRRDTGMTPQPLLMFAEAVIARRPGAQINKLEHQWLEGLWVGRDGSTDEHLVASGGGIVRCRAVKRMTEDRRRLAARFGSFQWTPWAPSAVQRGRPPKAREDAEKIVWVRWDANTSRWPLLPEHRQQQHQLLSQSHQCRSPRRQVLHSQVRLRLLRRLPLPYRLQQCQSRKRR